MCAIRPSVQARPVVVSAVRWLRPRSNSVHPRSRKAGLDGLVSPRRGAERLRWQRAVDTAPLHPSGRHGHCGLMILILPHTANTPLPRVSHVPLRTGAGAAGRGVWQTGRRPFPPPSWTPPRPRCTGRPTSPSGWGGAASREMRGKTARGTLRARVVHRTTRAKKWPSWRTVATTLRLQRSLRRSQTT